MYKLAFSCIFLNIKLLKSDTKVHTSTTLQIHQVHVEDTHQIDVNERNFKCIESLVLEGIVLSSGPMGLVEVNANWPRHPQLTKKNW